MDLKKLLHFLPEVKHPAEKKLSFNVKLKWTLIILAAFFVLANIPLYGLAKNALERFEYLALILGTDFGSIISLGIGPIVMSSIILQLLAGSGVLRIDTNTTEGKKYFQGIQKLGVLFFIVFEAMVYVIMGGLAAVQGYAGIMIAQLILGGLAIMFMDEVVQKWGFGSGVSIFIVAGVAWRLFTSLFQFIGAAGENCLVDFSGTPCAGKLLIIIQSIINGAPKELMSAVAAIAITAGIFLAVVWAQSLKVEVPLAYDRLRGFGMKWPLAFFYASNIPVILTGALVANIQLFGGMLENWLGHATFVGGFSSGQPVSGLAFWIGSPNLLEGVIKGSLQSVNIIQGILHMLFFMIISAVFAVFWVKTSGMDEHSQAKKIMASGLQIPGFRKDERILESIGTAILLAVMIMYQLYESIAQQHAVDMHPAMRKMIGQ